jgi:hypothetical protein
MRGSLRAALVVVCFGACGCGDAGTTVTGRVKDRQGRDIEGAEVILQFGADNENPSVSKTQTDEKGFFRVRVGHSSGYPNLILRVSKPGFRTHERSVRRDKDFKELKRDIVLEPDEAAGGNSGK